ncbi:unnamed protein product [Closterium sp. NIES-53]
MSFAQFGDEAERPRWAELLRSRIAIFDLDYDALLAAVYALSVSAEGDCYLCVPPDPGIEAAALDASESGTLPGTAPAKALHTLTLDSGASRCFFRDSTTLTPLSTPVSVRLADPSGGADLARSSTNLPCPAVPSGSLSGPHLPSFSTNLVSTAALQDAMVITTTPGGHRVLICMCTRMGRHLAMFTRRHGSSQYTLATEPPQVAATAQVSASGTVAPPCSCRLLSHQTLLWHRRLGHPSLPRLRGMHSRLLGRERYFVLVVDNYTLCLQLRERFSADLTVLHLHSDRGGEFSSDLLREFCRGEGILQSFLLPASPKQNGIAEHRIGFVMEVAHTSMIHAAAPHFLWPFVVRYAAHQLNLWPCVSLPETSPTLHWTGEVGDASVFRVWGSRAFVRDTSADKLSARVIPYVFLGFPPDAPGWQFYHPTSRRVFPSHDVTFDELVPFYRLFSYRSAPLPPPPLFLAPGPPTFRTRDSFGKRVDHSPLSEISPSVGTVTSAASGGAEPGGAEAEGAVSGGAEHWGAEPGGAEPAGVEPRGSEPEDVEPGGAESEGAVCGGAEPRGTASSGGAAGALPGLGAAGARDSAAGDTGAGDVGVTRLGGARVIAGAVGTGGTVAAGPGGSRTRGTGVAGTGSVGGGGAGAVDPAEPGDARAGGARAGGPGAGVAGVGGAGARETEAVDPGAGGAGAGGSPLLALPYAEQTDSFTERREPESRPASPFRAGRTRRRVPHLRPPLVPGTLAMALRPSSLPLRVPLPPPPESSLLPVPDPESDLASAASPTVSHLLATVVTDPSFESTAASALVAELVDFAPACRLDYAIALVAESDSDSPPSVGDECALGTDVLEDRQEDFECLAADVPHLVTLLLAPEGDPDAPAIPTPCTYADAITGQPARGDPASPPTWLHSVVSCRYPVEPPAASLRSPPGTSRVARHTTVLGLLLRLLTHRCFYAPTRSCRVLRPRITWDRARHTITLTQSHMVHQVLQRFGFQFSLPQPTPLSAGHSLLAPPLDESVEPSGPYPELVGCLITSGVGLVLGRRGLVFLTGQEDASWIDDSATQRSSRGYTFSLGSGSVSWRYTRSSSVLSSNCEAEIYVGAMAAQELCWLTYLLTDLGEQPHSPSVMYQRGQLRLAYVATSANTADIFTKALQSSDHQRFTVLGLLPTLPHLLSA